MKKLLLILALFVPMMIAVSCNSPESNARKQIERRMDAGMNLLKKAGSAPEDAKYIIEDCIYSANNDSIFIFLGAIVDRNGSKEKVEYIFRQYEDEYFVGLKFLETSGSLLRNQNKKTDSGSSTDDVVNRIIEESGVWLSMTIYNDLRDGSLIDITKITE
ncbi:MAG: hypothetical protein HDS80_05785 [Bacteroidales bacterium]|nr:hypothetical protein [Bacteroidales bacterium]